MRITVYGTGCAKCKQLAQNAAEAVAQAGIAAEIEKVEKVADIVKAGVMVTPGLAVNGKVKAAGKVPEVAKIVAWIHEAE